MVTRYSSEVICNGPNITDYKPAVSCYSQDERGYKLVIPQR